MRHNQNQNNKRTRGRSRKQHNPSNRSHESNGPDVKIRGNAVHIADKYLTLARDSTSSGDPVSAENYLQHAEHYLRLISAANSQAQAQSQNKTTDASVQTANGRGDAGEDNVVSAGEASNGGRQAKPERQNQPQPATKASSDNKDAPEIAGDDVRSDGNDAIVETSGEDEVEPVVTAEAG